MVLALGGVVALRGRASGLFALILSGLVLAGGLVGAAQAQSPSVVLAKRLDDRIRAAEKAVAAGDCRKFEQETSAAREALDDLWRVLESQFGPELGEEQGQIASKFEELLNPLMEEGCPKGSDFTPKSDIGLQIKNEFTLLRTQVRAAQTANDCVARDARLVDLKVLRDRLDSLNNSTTNKDERDDLQSHKNRIKRLIAEIESKPCPQPKIKISLFPSEF